MPNPINASSPLPPPSGGAARSQGREAAPSTAATRQEVAGSGSSEPVQVVQQAPRQSAQELAQATSNISDYIQSVSRSLQISVDDDLGTTVIRVLDAETDELVRQIPAEEALALARFISEQQAAIENDAAVPGILLDQEG